MAVSFSEGCTIVADNAVFLIWVILGLALVAVRSRRRETTGMVAGEKDGRREVRIVVVVLELRENKSEEGMTEAK